MSTGQLFFKKSADFINENSNIKFPMNYILNPWFYVAIFLFIISTLVWTQALRKIPLSLAYPMASLAYIITIIGACYFFRERISIVGIIGVTFIVFGITLSAIGN